MPDSNRLSAQALTPDALVMMDTIARTGSFAAAVLALRGSGGVVDRYDPKAHAPSKWSVHEP